MPAPIPTNQLIVATIDLRTATGKNNERYALEENFEKIVRPATELEATLGTAAAVRTYTAANKNLLLTGTNPTSVFSTGGGNRIGTTGASSDRAIVAPGQLTGVAFSAWNETQWSTDKQPRFDMEFRITDVSQVSFLMGLAQSVPTGAGTEEDVASLGNNAIILAYNNASTVNPTGLRPVTVSAGTKVDSPGTSPVTGATPIPALVAGTTYRVSISLDANRMPTYTISSGGSLIAQFSAGASAPLAAATNLIPFIYIRAREAAAKSYDLRQLRVSQIS